MFLYTRKIYNDTDSNDETCTGKAFNLAMYNEISISKGDSEKTVRIMEASGGDNDGYSLLVAERTYTNGDGFVFAVLDINSTEILQKLFDSIIDAMGKGREVYCVDDFYKEIDLSSVKIFKDEYDKTPLDIDLKEIFCQNKKIEQLAEHHKAL